MSDYPPAPWRLKGDMYVSLWRLPLRSVPAWDLPPGVRPLTMGGRCVLTTFWVDYQRGSVLEYHEFLVSLLVRHRRGIVVTAVAVWVDDERSLAGGHELWGIPKELGMFALDSAAGFTAELATGPGETVTTAFRDRLRLPAVRLPVRTRLVQRKPDGSVCEVPLRLSGPVGLGRERLRAPATGPLAFLAGHRPSVTVALRGFRFLVGEAVSAAPPS
ncbi:acetoacetate decarboxylase family protein [Streptomyces sp. NBC_01803]|uniref:acetoacetate decarboxylase family protein n=1 Tax=Streptomyces sp. NBC_01803 TaxID=2975946 RepID=UPI002DD7B403|nr:acetoacetate decarboxylase family protein [Streptomyces sp. NBC_01803]WSA46346.1 acetoacetate decarboxylase family protein [Streptomyces sp. NBC_01803]